MKLLIKEALEDALLKLNISRKVILTDAKDFGDFSSNIAMVLQKDLGKNPLEIAQMIVEKINKEKFLIEKIEIVKPGFINFFLDHKFYVYLLEKFSKNDFLIELEKTYTYNLEYVSANPTGFLHIGHARGAAIGDTLANILEFANNKVIREYYVNDAGNQISILAYALYIRYQQILGNKTLNLPEDSYHGEDIKYFAKIFHKKYQEKFKNVDYSLEVENFFKDEGVKIALEKIKLDLKTFRVEFDLYTSEKSIYPLIEKSLKKLKNTYEQDGALWLKTTDYGDDKDRVLIKNDGTYTYFAPDLAYHYVKKTRSENVDYLIDFFGADHIGYVKRMQIALEQFGFSKDTLNVLILEMVKLRKNGTEFVMSKRKGTAISLEDLIELIGVDNARFFLVDHSSSSKLDLEIDLIAEKNLSNGAFIIQYAYARTNSILEKTKVTLDVKLIRKPFDDKFEMKLVNVLKEFPILIEKIAENFKIHLLSQYLITLAKSFNSFYSNSKIIDSEEELKLILLVKATQAVLKKGLDLLKVEAPERI
ncbi:arginine--tRNA ligase [[Mycoplasma] mobile]|nr:arginine--tRNA ligase [[Mycoplasma] mobile]